MEHRPLVLEPELYKRCKSIKQFIRMPENWLHAYRMSTLPAARDLHVIHIPYGFSAILSVSVMSEEDQRPFLHMTLSVDEENALPNPISVATIATLLGFSGAEKSGGIAVGPGVGWLLTLHPHANAVALFQLLEDSDLGLANE